MKESSLNAAEEVPLKKDKKDKAPDGRIPPQNGEASEKGLIRYEKARDPDGPIPPQIGEGLGKAIRYEKARDPDGPNSAADRRRPQIGIYRRRSAKASEKG